MYGRSRIRLEGQDYLIDWTDVGQTLCIKHIRLKITDFKEFIYSITRSLKDLMYDDRLFGASSPPTIELKKLPFDDMMETQPGCWLIRDLAKGKCGGHSYMVRLAEEVNGEKKLIQQNDWDYDKVREYLDKKMKFLELLMLPPRGETHRKGLRLGP